MSAVRQKLLSSLGTVFKQSFVPLLRSFYEAGRVEEAKALEAALYGLGPRIERMLEEEGWRVWCALARSRANPTDEGSISEGNTSEGGGTLRTVNTRGVAGGAAASVGARGSAERGNGREQDLELRLLLDRSASKLGLPTPVPSERWWARVLGTARKRRTTATLEEMDAAVDAAARVWREDRWSTARNLNYVWGTGWPLLMAEATHPTSKRGAGPRFRTTAEAPRPMTQEELDKRHLSGGKR